MKFAHKKLNLDQFLRYHPVLQLIEKKDFAGQPILEVGSGVNGISDYYSGQVIGVDQDFSKTASLKNKNIKHVKGEVTSLPFSDGSFSVVVCLDTLEHLPVSLRQLATLELLRVTRPGGFLFLGFPEGQLSSFFERIINYLYKRRYGVDHPWLREHLGYRLPEACEVIDKVKKDKVRIIKNVNIFIWFFLHLVVTVFNCHPDYRKGIFWRIFSFLGNLSVPPVYRHIFIIQK